MVIDRGNKLAHRTLLILTGMYGHMVLLQGRRTSSMRTWYSKFNIP